MKRYEVIFSADSIHQQTADVIKHAHDQDVEIDRTKHDIDVIEHVLGSSDEEMRSEVVELPWLGGITASAVQIRIGGLRSGDDEPGDDQ